MSTWAGADALPPVSKGPVCRCCRPDRRDQRLDDETDLGVVDDEWWVDADHVCRPEAREDRQQRPARPPCHRRAVAAPVRTDEFQTPHKITPRTSRMAGRGTASRDRVPGIAGTRSTRPSRCMISMTLSATSQPTGGRHGGSTCMALLQAPKGPSGPDGPRRQKGEIGRRDAFGHGDDVGANLAGALKPNQVPQRDRTGDDLVDDQQYAVPLADLGDLQEASGGFENAAGEGEQARTIDWRLDGDPTAAIFASRPERRLARSQRSTRRPYRRSGDVDETPDCDRER